MIFQLVWSKLLSDYALQLHQLRGLSNPVSKDLAKISFCLKRLVLKNEIKSCSGWFKEHNLFHQRTVSSLKILFSLIPLPEFVQIVQQLGWQ